MKAARKRPDPPSTPTLDKLKSVSDKSQAIGAFLEWLQSEQKVQLMRYHEHNDSCRDEDDEDEFVCGLDDEMFPNHSSIEQLLADYFEIDLKEVEKERRALLDWQRELNDG
jgi:hypothetical protein